ncbi:hypothetical protein KJ975_12495 [Myxococcota bacterium]|nr:hypothetical protein [Myxococcota bacterium]
MKKSDIKTWLFPAVMLTGAAIGILLLWPREVKPPTMEEAKVRPVPPVPGAPLEEVDRMDVRNRYGEFSLEKRADGWMMIRPFLARANQTVIKSLFERLGKAEFGIVVSRDVKSQEQEKVAGKLAVEIRLHRGAEPVWHFFLGKSSDFTLFRMADSNDIWQIRGALRQQFVRDSVGWIEPALIVEPQDALRSVRYMKADRSLFAHFRIEKPGAPTLGEGQEHIRSWHPARVKRSLARLFQGRLHLVEADPAKNREAFKTEDGGVELEFASGRQVRLTFGVGDGKDTPVRIEEKAPKGEKYQEYPYIAIVHSHMLRETLLKRTLDLEDPVIFSTAAESVEALRGLCDKFSYELERDARKVMVVKSSSQTFALAKSSLEEFFRFLSQGLLTAATVLEPGEVPAEFAVTPKSDHVEFDLLVERKKSTVRVAWGAMTPLDSFGIRYHYVTVSTRPGLVFRVMEKNILPICRTKTTWQLKAEDPENIPVPGARRR